MFVSYGYRIPKKTIEKNTTTKILPKKDGNYWFKEEDSLRISHERTQSL